MTTGRQGMAEALNFLVTNRLPRRLATRLVGRISKVEAWPVRVPALTLWRLFCRVDLSDAAETRFRSLHDGFTRALRPGARRFDPDPTVIASPCDAIVGACGTVRGERLLQVKGMPYRLRELVGDAEVAAAFAGGRYVTLRLTAGMYHRFHAPADLTVDRVDHIDGDCWNVNPPALARVKGLYCRNERAVVHARLAGGERLLIVAVAAVLVAGIRLHALGPGLLRGGGSRRGLAAPAARGAELGWFEHGSTIVLLLPATAELAPGIQTGHRVRAGERLATLVPEERT